MGDTEDDKWLTQFALIQQLVRAHIPAGRGGSFSALSAERFLGVTPKKWKAWAKGQRPSAGDLACISRRLGLTPHWLLFGEGEPFLEKQEAADGAAPVREKTIPLSIPISAPAPAPRDTPYAPSEATGAEETLDGSPVGEIAHAPGLRGFAAAPMALTGLAECGIQGWYREAKLRAPVAPPLVGSDWLVIMAVGNSMIPAGIHEGHILYCDPAQAPAEHEPVYVLRIDGAASIKLWRGVAANGFAVLQGWLPPDAQGNQKPYLDQVAPDQIRRLAPVIYIRLRI